jgi:D-methionine transport system ATP-binding protein
MHVVKQACDSVSLLEGGKIVEHGDIEAVITNASGRLASTLLPLPGDAPRAEGSGPILDLLYTGQQATEPVISSLARKFNTDVNVLAGSVEQLGEQQYAHLRLQLTADADLEAIVNHLSSTGIAVTVKGAK